LAARENKPHRQRHHATSGALDTSHQSRTSFLTRSSPVVARAFTTAAHATNNGDTVLVEAPPSINKTNLMSEAVPTMSADHEEKGWRRIDWTKCDNKEANVNKGVDGSHNNQKMGKEGDTNTFANNPASAVLFETKISSYQPMYHPNSSPVEVVLVRSKRIHVKRDDLLRLPGSHVSGNKARKLLSLEYLPSSVPFPQVLVSYGGPQSNAMVALAAIVNHQNSIILPDDARKGQQQQQPKRFVYYAKKLPRWLRKQPSGNLLRAMSLGMELVELSPIEYKELFGGPDGGSVDPPSELDPPVPGDSVWVPQGAASPVARAGVQRLAQEIVEYWSDDISPRGGRNSSSPLAVVLAAGTGTVASFLHIEIQALLQQQRSNNNNCTHLDIVVVAIPVVGDAEYTARQMRALDESSSSSGGENSDSESSVPYMLEPRRRRAFGTPSTEIMDAFNYLKQECGLFVDLLYGAPAWATLLEPQHWNPSNDKHPLAGRQIMYINCGGLEGIASQMTRYKHKGLIQANESQ
jgi:1-aminocyclopropane-1-carboxylate deaminase